MWKQILIGAGGVALVIAIILAVRNYTADFGSEKIESVYVDELNVGEIKKWFSDKITTPDVKGAILYPTPVNIAKWKLNIDPAQQGNMLIQAVYDEGKDEILNYRQVIFGTLSSKLQELLDANGGVLVIEI